MTAHDAATGPSRDLPERALIWLGHYGFEIALATMTLVIASIVLPAPAVHAPAWTLTVTYWGAYATTGLALLILFAIVKHDRSLCARDFQVAPLLDPEGAVRRRIRELRLVHTRAVYILVVMVILADALNNKVFHNRPPLWYAATFCAVEVAWAYMLWSLRAHRHLADFCPFCHGRGPDDDPTPVTPDPVAPARTNR